METYIVFRFFDSLHYFDGLTANAVMVFAGIGVLSTFWGILRFVNAFIGVSVIEDDDPPDDDATWPSSYGRDGDS